MGCKLRRLKENSCIQFCILSVIFVNLLLKRAESREMPKTKKVLSENNSTMAVQRIPSVKRKNSNDSLDGLGKRLKKSLDMGGRGDRGSQEIEKNTNVASTSSASQLKKEDSKSSSGSVKSQSSTSSLSSATTVSTPSNSFVQESVPDQDLTVELRCFDALRTTLGGHYFDVCSRLCLDYTPGCVRRVEICAQIHSGRKPTKIEIFDEYLQVDAKQFVVEDRPMHFIKFLEDLLSRNEFPGHSMILAALELILTISDSNPNLVIKECSNALENILNKFPPCWHGLKEPYARVLFGRLENGCFLNYSDEGLLKAIILLFEKCISKDDGGAKARDCKIALDECNNYTTWERMQLEQRANFDLNDRNDQIDRLLIVLKYLIKIMEMDLSIWMLKYPKNTKMNMENLTKKPLIARFLWTNAAEKESGETNNFIKKVLTIFVDIIGMNYPEETTNVFSRLINLIGVTINLSEFQAAEEQITYPFVKHHTAYFVEQIGKTIEASNRYTFQLFFNVIKMIKTPFIKMFLVDELLKKLNSKIGEPTSKKFFQHLRKEKWLEYQAEPANALPERTSTAKYPVLDNKKSRPKYSEVTKSEYLQLLLVGFKSFVETYRISNFVRENVNTIPSSAAPVQKTHSCSPAKKLELEHTNSQFDFDALEKDVEMLASQVKMNNRIVKNLIRTKENALIFHGVLVDTNLLLHYRDEMKYFLIIYYKIMDLYQQEPELFREWHQYMSNEMEI